MLDTKFKRQPQRLFLMADAEGGLWFPESSQGLACWRSGRLASYSLAGVRGSKVPLCLAQDREQNLWLGTDLSAASAPGHEPSVNQPG